MPHIEIYITEETKRFYQKIADHAGLPLEQVLSDALFKLAGDLAMYVGKDNEKEHFSG